MEKRVYFKNLNGLRFWAATAVIFHHVEQYKSWAGLPNIWGHPVIDALGHKAVSLFFVLSGFLITYLLLAEQQQTGEINVRNFYIRRILRIWPLYYLIVVLCLFVLPHVFDLSTLGLTVYDHTFWPKLILLLLVLPNVVRLFSPNTAGGNQLWSIGVEEQFYLIWPLLVRWFIPRLMGFLVVFVLLKLMVTLVLMGWIAWQPGMSLPKVGLHFWILLQIEQMSIGAMGAWALFHRKEAVLRVLYHPAAWGLSLLALLLLIVIPSHHWLISYLEAIVFLVLILNLSTNPRFPVSMENKAYTSLGNISYGIYMYHTVCITVCIFLLQRTGLQHTHFTWFNILLYTLSIAMTIGVSFLSYRYFETFFLNFKEKFMIVKSGKRDAD